MTQFSVESLFWGSEAGRNNADENELSLEEFNGKVQGYLNHITESRDALYVASVPFRTAHRSILPVQCKIALQSLEELDKPVQDFSRLLHQTEGLPFIFTGLRYRLLPTLNLVEDQINRLLNLLDRYRNTYISPTQQEKWLRKEISSTFEMLLQLNTSISERVRILNEEIGGQGLQT